MSDHTDLPLSVPAAIEHRRSVRHFEPDPIPDDVLRQLIELSVMAPTSWNLQPVRMVLVSDADQRQQLHEACFYQPQVKEAPVSFVFAIEIGGW